MAHRLSLGVTTQQPRLSSGPTAAFSSTPGEPLVLLAKIWQLERARAMVSQQPSSHGLMKFPSTTPATRWHLISPRSSGRAPLKWGAPCKRAVESLPLASGLPSFLFVNTPPRATSSESLPKTFKFKFKPITPYFYSTVLARCLDSSRIHTIKASIWMLQNLIPLYLYPLQSLLFDTHETRNSSLRSCIETVGPLCIINK